MVLLVMPMEMFQVLVKKMLLERDRNPVWVRLDLLLELLDEIISPEADVRVVVEILHESRGGSAS